MIKLLAAGLMLLLALSLTLGLDSAALMLELRLPRLLGALLVGAALGAAGLLMQTMTRNPLAEPGLLGVNSGAALGVVAGMAWGGAVAGPGYLAWALAGAAAGSLAVLAVAHLLPGGALRLILAGLAIGATFHGASSAILLSAPSGYDQYRFWVLGSLAGVTLDMVRWAAAPLALALAAAMLIARPLSALMLGEDLARTLGQRPAMLRLGVALVTTVLTGSAVALAGPVAFLGLLAPHLARAMKTTSLAHALILSAAVGAGLLVLADMGARLVAHPFEAPLSVLTALAGAPLLVLIARRCTA